MGDREVSIAADGDRPNEGISPSDDGRRRHVAPFEGAGTDIGELPHVPIMGAAGPGEQSGIFDSAMPPELRGLGA